MIESREVKTLSSFHSRGTTVPLKETQSSHDSPRCFRSLYLRPGKITVRVGTLPKSLLFWRSRPPRIQIRVEDVDRGNCQGLPCFMATPCCRSSGSLLGSMRGLRPGTVSSVGVRERGEGHGSRSISLGCSDISEHGVICRQSSRVIPNRRSSPAVLPASRLGLSPPARSQPLRGTRGRPRLWSL